MNNIFSQIMDFMFTPFGFFIVLLIAPLFFAMFRRKKQIEKVKNEMMNKAETMDMQYSAPSYPSVMDKVFFGEKPERSSPSDHQLKGETNGIKWKVNTIHLKDTDLNFNKATMQDISKRYTRWSTYINILKNPDYILIMNMPENFDKKGLIANHEPQNTGFMGKFANKVGNKLLNSYISLYFGKEQLNVTPAEQQHRIDIINEFESEFSVFSNNSKMATKILNSEMLNELSSPKFNEVSWLINSNGIIASVPTYMISSDEIQNLADICSQITNKII